MDTDRGQLKERALPHQKVEPLAALKDLETDPGSVAHTPRDQAVPLGDKPFWLPVAQLLGRVALSGGTDGSLCMGLRPSHPRTGDRGLRASLGLARLRFAALRKDAAQQETQERSSRRA